LQASLAAHRRNIYLAYDQLLAKIDSAGAINYVHPDHLNTPQKMTDATQAIVFDRVQQPFGEPATTGSPGATNNLRFPGQYADSESLLNYNLMRDYDPTLGRYIESDPIGLEGASTTSINLFGYVGQNALRYADPYGLVVQLCKQPAFGISWSPINHYWIKTDTKEAGMGPTKSNCGNAGNEFGDMPGDPVQICDHSKRDKTASTCETISDVDEEKVNKQLEIGKSLGHWWPWNQCQSFTDDVLNQSRINPNKP
jgi:RHS repeat-associated protein